MDKQLEMLIVKSVLQTISTGSGCLFGLAVYNGNQKHMVLALGIGLISAWIGR